MNTSIQDKIKEEYAHLKEINSLMAIVAKIDHQIQDNSTRLHFIIDKRQLRQSEIKNKKAELEKTKAELNSLDLSVQQLIKKLEKMNRDLDGASTLIQQTTLEKEIAFSQNQKDELENKSFNELEKMEQLELDIKNAEQFLIGSLVTLNEIQSEVDAENANINNEKVSAQERIKLLRDILNPVTNEILNNSLKHGYKTSIFATSQNGYCSNCRMQFDRHSLRECDTFKEVINCFQCKKIVLPAIN